MGNILGRVLGKLVSSRGKGDSPDNVSNMVDVVSVVPREDARDVSRHGLKDQWPRRSHQRLGSWDETRQKDPS